MGRDMNFWCYESWFYYKGLECDILSFLPLTTMYFLVSNTDQHSTRTYMIYGHICNVFNQLCHCISLFCFLNVLKFANKFENACNIYKNEMHVMIMFQFLWIIKFGAEKEKIDRFSIGIYILHLFSLKFGIQFGVGDLSNNSIQ